MNANDYAPSESKIGELGESCAEIERRHTLPSFISFAQLTSTVVA